MSRLYQKHYWLFFLLLSLAIHLPFMNRPPESVHVWRQCNTLAMARNFSEEGMNIAQPKVDRRGNNNGITGSQFPSYEYILAISYKAFGEHFFLHRFLSFLLYAFGAFGMYRLAFFIFKNDIAANIAAIGYLFSPELFYHGINALPDILALPCSIWAFYYYLKWIDSIVLIKEKRQYGWMSLALLILAGLTKLQFLVVGVPMAVYTLQNIKSFTSVSKIIQISIFVLLALFIPISWYIYARHLILVSGLTDFGLEIRSVHTLSEVFTILQGNLISDLPEQLLGYVFALFFVIGIYLFIKGKKWESLWIHFFLIWAIALFTWQMIELSQMKFHGYYMMCHIPFLLLIASYGAIYICKRNYWILIALVCIQPIITSLRILPSRWMNKDKHLPVELYTETSRIKLQNAVPQKDICIIGPDESGCIFFYFLHKKGFGFSKPEELFTKNMQGQTLLEYDIKQGAKYLYIYDVSSNDSVSLSKYKKIKQEGKFSVYSLTE